MFITSITSITMSITIRITIITLLLLWFITSITISTS